MPTSLQSMPRTDEVPPTPATENVVEVREITKFYGTDVHALEKVNLGIPVGQMTTFLGPSGCGKTTLLKIIAGLLEPSAGEILVKGVSVSGPGPNRAPGYRVTSGAPDAAASAATRAARCLLA